MDLKSTYEIIQYTSESFAESSPEYLQTIGMLLELDPTPHTSARVLEIGCAYGENILPLASRNPNSTYVGIDLSDAHIFQANKAKEECDIKNINFYCADISKFDFSKEEPFDYIICHGVFSWVPPEVQESILDICYKHLNKNGLIYISYNVLPGWSQLSALRNMMLIHTKKIPPENIKGKIEQSVKLVEFLAKNSKDPIYKSYLEKFSEKFASYAPYYIAHEFLEYYNEPFYFKDFVGKAESHNLRYVIDADINSIYPTDFGPEVKSILYGKNVSMIDSEQYLDFLRNRQFRKSILTRNDNPKKANINSIESNLKKLYFKLSNEVKIDKEDISSNKSIKTLNKNRLEVVVKDPAAKAVLYALKESLCKPLSYDELYQKSSILINGENKLKSSITNMTINNLIIYYKLELNDRNIDNIDLDSKYILDKYQRKILTEKNCVVNGSHRTLKIQKNKLEEYVIKLLDGKNTIRDISNSILEQHNSNKIKLSIENPNIEIILSHVLSVIKGLIFMELIYLEK